MPFLSLSLTHKPNLSYMLCSRSAVVAAAAAAAANPRVFFSSESAPEVLTASKGWWEPIYGVPIGLAFAIPALKYEWILVNEETQVRVYNIIQCNECLQNERNMVSNSPLPFSSLSLSLYQ